MPKFITKQIIFDMCQEDTFKFLLRNKQFV